MIRTTYHGPTNYKGSRIIADDGEGKRAIVPFDYALDSDARHEKAALKLCEREGWPKPKLVGWYKNSAFWSFRYEAQQSTTD